MLERKNHQENPYEGVTPESLCPSPNNKKEVKRKIKNCECKDCSAFIQKSLPTSAFTITRRGLLAVAGLGAAALALKRILPGDPPAATSATAPVVSATVEKSPEEIIYQKILQELEADEKHLQGIIDTIEGPFLDALKKARAHPGTMPPELNKRIAGIIGAIEVTRQCPEKNRYSLAIRFLKEKNGSVPKHHIKEKNMRSGAHWLKLIDSENQWKTSPPYFSYQLNVSDQNDVAHYDLPAGTLSFSRSFSFQSLVEWMVVIHELTHVVQFQERLSNASPQETTNLRSNLMLTTPTGEALLPKYYIFDIEVDAYATCFEIGNIMTEGGFERIILKNRDDRDHSIRPKNARDDALIGKIFEGCPAGIADDALSLAIPYFEQAGVYPLRSQRLETKIRMRKVGVLVRSEELFRTSPDEFKKMMWARERQK